MVRASLARTPLGQRTIERRPGGSAPADLPADTFLSARDRLPPFPEDAPVGWSDAAQAEADGRGDRRAAAGRRARARCCIIEEPELMLTPHQQRHLYELLRRYSERNQVIYSTRSPAMLDAVHYEEIVRLDRTRRAACPSVAPRSELLTDEQRVRLEAEFDHERNEMFFATAVVLVEGQTERLALPLIFRRLGHDPDALGISIVEVGGKGNLVLHRARAGRAAHSAPDRVRLGPRPAGPAARTSSSAASRPGAGHRARSGLRGRRRHPSHEDKVFNAWRRFSTIDAERIPSESSARSSKRPVRLAAARERARRGRSRSLGHLAPDRQRRPRPPGRPRCRRGRRCRRSPSDRTGRSP